MAEKEFSTYKGRPLVRCKNELYYGSMEEAFVAHLVIKSTKEENGLKIADTVAVQLLCTDPDLPPNKQVVKAGTQTGLYAAIDVADIWLERALANKITI